MLNKFLSEPDFREDIPLPSNGSNEKRFAEIEAYVEKRNKKKLVTPTKYRSTGGLDKFERQSRARQVQSKKGCNLFGEKIKPNTTAKSYSLAEASVRTPHRPAAWLL